MTTLDWVAMILVIIGGINWGLVGLLDYNLVESLFREGTFLTKIIYDLVGLSAIYMIFVSMKQKEV
ncbi:DUF378 domain-containing protein [Candidatus Berkelbacteria bacterium]|nr:DUF378 domain-containing protein [Candidatus Berkelbacteria bacterium]